MIQDLSVTTKDGLGYKGLYSASEDTGSPVILFIPGMSGIYDNEKTQYWLSELPKHSISFFLLDIEALRGFKRSMTK